MTTESCESLLTKARSIVERCLQVKCQIDCETIKIYLLAPTYEGDLVKPEAIMQDFFLFLHEVAEICILTSWGYKITPDIIVKAYPNTYKAHLLALRVELDEAVKAGKVGHLERRCKDLKSYLRDLWLPKSLVNDVNSLIKQYCS